MDIAKFNLFKSGQTAADKEKKKTQEQLAAESDRRKSLIRAMVRSDGWKVLEEDLLREENIRLEKLAKVSMFRFWESEQIKQEKKAVRWLLNRINSYLIES